MTVFKTPAIPFLRPDVAVSHPITGVATSITVFLGRTTIGPTTPTGIGSFVQFQSLYGGLNAGLPLTYAVRDFFQNGGSHAIIVRLTRASAAAGMDNGPLAPADFIGEQASGTGLYQLARVAFNTLCIPPDTFTTDIDPTVYAAAPTYCSQRRAMLVIDPPLAWTTALKGGNINAISPAIFGIPAAAASDVAVYAPRILEPDPLNNDQLTAYAPCGAVAGIWAATDANRAVWKAPAGEGTALTGVTAPEVALTDAQADGLNLLGINCIRHIAGQGTLVWGARTLGSGTFLYVPVRRLALYIESSLHQGIQWAVFEPNAEPLWTALRLEIDGFLMAMFKQGAFQGATPSEAFFVKCDATTMTESDIANGIVNIVVGVAPLRPAEFVIINIQQWLATPAKKPPA